jgi:hypothetical protein
MSDWQPKFGDICRAKCGAQARYLRDGKCLFVCAMDNDLSVDDAVPAAGGEEKFPLPSDEHLEGANAAGLTFQ